MSKVSMSFIWVRKLLKICGLQAAIPYFQIFTALAIGAALVMPAHAQSKRCPLSAIGVSKDASANATEAEKLEIFLIWKDLGGTSVDGSDGPLGCPYGEAVVPEDAAGWTGISQPFQRGTILIGRGDSSGQNVAVIRGLNAWTVWWNGFSNDVRAFRGTDASGLPTPEVQAAAWNRGGTVQIAQPDANIALWSCQPPEGCQWVRVTPLLSAPSANPFDAPARLELNDLVTPNASKRYERVNAIFADWLPCFTNLPADVDPGEDDLGRALVMMRRAGPCPLTNLTPRAQIIDWLGKVSFSSDHVPGTDQHDWPCERKGDLDVTLVMLLHLTFEHWSEIDSITIDKLRNLLEPWGGLPRESPYLSPTFGCVGFQIIETENHILMQESARYLINELLSSRIFGVDSDHDNSANRVWLVRFLQQLVRRDFYEFNSLPYTRYALKGLVALHDYAPNTDDAVRKAAEAALHWLFAKQAFSGNLDRDHRYYRRQPRADRYADKRWWGSASIATAQELAVLVGPLNHVSTDIDLQLNEKDGQAAWRDIVQYPRLGAAEEAALAPFADIADTKYQLPNALRGWLEDRFIKDEVNRTTYLQAFHHVSPVADDPNFFRQPNFGAEIVSGNRNWTIIAGGQPVGPGDPGPPPESGALSIGHPLVGGTAGAVGGAVALAGAGAIVGSVIPGIGTVAGGIIGGAIGLVGGLFGGAIAPDIIAADKQHSKLWEDQASTIRETILIPTAVGVDRSHTIRFGMARTLQDREILQSRMCVSHGFMCGFDLNMPSHPFPANDAGGCPIRQGLPEPLKKYEHLTNGADQKIWLGCLLQRPGEMRGWQLWTYERGTFAFAVADPPNNPRLIAAWIDTTDPEKRLLRIEWRLPGQPQDWFNVYPYNFSVETTSGRAPAGYLEFRDYGDAGNTNTVDRGEVQFEIDIDKYKQDSTLNILIEACNPTYWVWRTGHKCRTNILPRVSVNITRPPKQSFSCKAEQYRERGLVMEVGGSCSESPYGFFVYLWSKSCSSNDECPENASDFGFAVVAPSRGWQWDEFAQIVDTSIADYVKQQGHEYRPSETAEVAIPISPPVVKTGQTAWQATGPAMSHVVSFRWRVPQGGDAQVVGDSAASGLYGVFAGNIASWPTALGNTLSPDVPNTNTDLLMSDGKGCFTIAGLPTPESPDPASLLVNITNAAAPDIREVRSSELAGACP